MQEKKGYPVIPNCIQIPQRGHGSVTFCFIYFFRGLPPFNGFESRWTWTHWFPSLLFHWFSYVGPKIEKSWCFNAQLINFYWFFVAVNTQATKNTTQNPKTQRQRPKRQRQRPKTQRRDFWEKKTRLKTDAERCKIWRQRCKMWRRSGVIWSCLSLMCFAVFITVFVGEHTLLKFI